MGYTITTPDGSFAIRVRYVKPGRYHLDVNTGLINEEVFFKMMKEFYSIPEKPLIDNDMASFYLELHLMAFQFEHDHLADSLANIYDNALAEHQSQYYFKPRTCQ